MRIKNFFLLSAAICINTFISAQITVNTSSVIATGVSNKIGINLNAMTDNDINRPIGSRSIVDALKEMNVKHLRFPGGEKSDFYKWTSDPNNPNPATNSFSSWYYNSSTGVGYSLLNFDQFISICQQVGAEPHIVVAIPSSYTSANVMYYDSTKTDFNISLAVAWVKYANITKGYGVKYWELGNENFDLKLSDSGLANLYNKFSDAMKAVDPTIKILAGCKTNSASAIKNICRDKVDFLTTASYPCWQWGTYNTYVNTTNPDLMVKSDVTGHTVGGNKVVMYEFNAIDYSNKNNDPKAWPNTNDVGHALVVFEMVGQLLMNNDLLYGNLWTSRWDSKWNGFSYCVNDALDDNNNFLAVSYPIKVWGQFLKNNMVNISRTNTVVTWASYDSESGVLNLFLENKAVSAQTTSVAITSSNSFSTGSVWQFKGTSTADKNPTFNQTGTISVTNNNIASLSLPAASVTVISLSGSTCTPTPIVPYMSTTLGGKQNTANITVSANTIVKLSPDPSTGGSWNWSGPNGLTTTMREFNFTPTTSGAYYFIATYTNSDGCQSVLPFTITVPPIYGLCDKFSAVAGTTKGTIEITGLKGAPNRQVWYSKNGGTSTQYPISSNDTITMSNLLVGDTYSITIYGWDANWANPCTKSFTIKIPNLTAVNNVNQSNLIIYPNPFTNSFKIQQTGFFKYELYDQLGRLTICGKSVNNVEIGDNLLPGFYLLTVHSEKGNQEQKLIKIK